jgi:hypothetical protein
LLLTTVATQALKEIFKEGFNYKKAGVVLSDFKPANKVTHDWEMKKENRSPN